MMMMCSRRLLDLFCRYMPNNGAKGGVRVDGGGRW